MDRYYDNNEFEGAEFSEDRSFRNSSNENRSGDRNCYVKPHNHEFSTSTNYAEDDECRIHNHRIACVTGPAIRAGKTHIHKIETTTDTFGDHYHKVCDKTGPAIYLPNGKHFHIVKGETGRAEENAHDHDYYFITAIEDPTNVPKSKKC